MVAHTTLLEISCHGSYVINLCMFDCEITCVPNYRTSLFKKKGSVRFFRMFSKLFSAIILGVRNFRVFQILEHLPYCQLQSNI